MLCADGVEGRVGLHAGFDEEERVSENGCARLSGRTVPVSLDGTKHTENRSDEKLEAHLLRRQSLHRQ